MTDDTMLPFSFPAVHAKKVTAAFDGGRLTSNGGVMLLAMAKRRLGLADNLARVFPDRRDPTRVVHMFAICCGYEDADDLDHLRSDPAFKLACGRLPDSGPGFVFPTDAVAAGEFAATARRDPTDLHFSRRMDE
jgi:hypothetical protein